MFFIVRIFLRKKETSRKDLLPLAASVDIALIGLAGDGDLGIFVVLLVFLLVARVAGGDGGSNSQDSGDDELQKS